MKTIIIILLVALSSACFSQWIPQNPKTTTNNLNDIQFVTELKGWVVGDFGTLLKSEDGGVNWNTVEMQTENDLHSLQFINENEGWIQGDGITLHTQDGGSSWVKQVETSVSGLSTISFSDEKKGMVAGVAKGFATWGSSVSFATIMQTSDGGNTWLPASSVSDNIRSLCSPEPGFTWILSFWSYYDDITSIVASDIYVTKDGGITLTEQYSGEPMSSIFFVDTLDGWAVGSEMVYTNDGGENWFVIPDIEGTDIYFIDTNTGWIAGAEGTVLSSLDGGLTWLDQNSGSDINLSAIWFNDTENGWIVGENGTILKTENGGTDWTPVSTGTFHEDLFTVSALNEYDCLAAGYNYEKSIVATTKNGGENWEPQYFQDFKINDVSFISNQTGWAAGFNADNHGTVLKTTDGGMNWEEQLTDSNKLNAIYFINDEIGWAAGTSLVWKTTDGGITWEYTYPGNIAIFNSLFFINEDYGWVVGTNAAMFSTNNGGESWYDHSLDFYHDFEDVWFLDEDHGFVAGEFGLLYTADAGISWEVKLKDVLSALYFIDSFNGWVSGIGGTILKTTDRGQEWSRQPSGTSKNLIDIAFADLSNGWVVGNSGTILYTDNGGTVWTPGNPDEELQVHLLTFPNPFSTSTTIEYNLKQASEVLIIIHNHLGELIQLINKYQSKGKQKFVWNAEGLPAGIYFCTIKTNTETQTTKMIKLK